MAPEQSRPRKLPDTAESAASTRSCVQQSQRSAGNQAAAKLLSTGAIQAGLRVSRPGDADELEADRVADQVVSSNSPTLHRKCNCEGGGASCPSCQEEEVEQAKGIYRKSNSSINSEESVHENFLDSKGLGQPLDPDTRGFMESRFGYNFGGVRVHTGDEAAQSARSIHARAYTHNQDVIFDSGSYAPKSPEGRRLLAHELTHVIQQSNSSSGKNLQRSTDETQTHPQEHKSEPGFFSKIGHGIAGAATTVWHGMKAAGQAIWKGIKTIGHGISVGAEAVWDGVKWLGGQLVDKVTGVFERVMHWITRLPERIARLLLGLWEGVKTLRPWALEWWASLGKASTWLGFVEWLGSRILELTEVLGVGEIAETISDFIKFNTRKLTSKEHASAASVFGSSINLSMVRIDTAGLSVWLGKKIMNYSEGRDFTTLHTINGLGGIADDTLIHELTHVWQYEHVGAIYAFQAIHAQGTPQGYDYGGVQGLKDAKASGTGIASFNREQQAQIVEDYYRIRTGRAAMFGDGTAADLPLFAHIVKGVSSLSESTLAAAPMGDFINPPGFPEKRMA